MPTVKVSDLSSLLRDENCLRQREKLQLQWPLIILRHFQTSMDTKEGLFAIPNVPGFRIVGQNSHTESSFRRLASVFRETRNYPLTTAALYSQPFIQQQ